MAEKKSEHGEADGPTDGEVEGSEGKKKKKSKLILIAGAAALLLAVGGGAAYFTGMFSSAPKTEATDKKGKKKKTEEGGEKERGTTGSSVKPVKQNPNEWVPGVEAGHEGDDVAYYNLPEFLVNLDTSGRQTSFIKMEVSLETASDSENTDAIDNRLPRIIDSFNTYLRTLRTSDIAGSAGLYRLREELLLRVNKIIYPAKVNDVLYREIIIQ